MKSCGRFILLIALYFSFVVGGQLSEADTLNSEVLADENDASRIAYNETVERKLVNVGRAPFAIASPKFNCQSFLNSMDKLDFLHIAWLFNSFGSDYRCLKKVLEDPRLITLQTNLINEPGHRNRRLEKHEFLYSVRSPSDYDRLLKSRNPQLKRRFQQYVAPLQSLLSSKLQPRTECLINPGLESNVSTRAGKVLVEWTREAFPFCKVVWNPIAETSTAVGTGAELVEQHGWFPTFKTRSCTFNNDGSDINFPERKTGNAVLHEKDASVPKNFLNAGNPLQGALEEYANQCKVVFLWSVEDNCFDYDKHLAPWLPPSKRTCKSGPVYPLVAKEIEHVHKNGVRAPKKFVYTEKEESSFLGCSSIKSSKDGFKSGFLLKPSEFSNRGGVILTPRTLNGASKIIIVHKGKVIDTYRRSGTFGEDRTGRALWRSDRSPLSYPLKVSVRIKYKNNTVCYRVDNPRIRND